MKKRVIIIDYGMGNVLSVARAFHYCGAEAILSDSPQEVLKADHLVLPGVGAFAHGWQGLHERNLIDPIRKKTGEGAPFLGICLGMQLMLDYSEEFGRHEGLGIIPGGVVPIPNTDIKGQPHKIPHMGWNKLLSAGIKAAWDDTVLHGVENGSSVYFVHSFTAVPTDEQCRLADTDYNGRSLSACIQSGRSYGCQFHPEKSGTIGLHIIKNFLSLDDQNFKFRARAL